MRKNPEEFVLWLNGAVDMTPGAAPTPEQWAMIRERLAECVGGIIKDRMLRARYEEEWERVFKRNQAYSPPPVYQPAWPTYTSSSADPLPPSPMSITKATW